MVYADSGTYLPGNNQKKSAQDAIDLLSQMGIPQIQVKYQGCFAVNGYNRFYFRV